MYNGVDSNSFRPLDKVPGKVVWASSHDRGLHWLLELWPKVRQAVPHANLHVFYDFNGLNMFSRWENTPTDNLIDQECAELGQRSRYIIEALHRLEPHGVFTHQSVSRERICQEMGSAEVLAYPCDPVHYTETFGVTVLEACASGAVPVICTADAFGELWGNVSLSVPPPFKQNKQAFVTNLINILTDSNLREKLSNACVKYAASFDWKSLTQYFSTFLESRGAAGLLEVQWEE
jgi:glycosyltransferase involved in cell wall biosynthesis